ncbi:MAG: TonB-dependent receptor [Prevotellaceae bacterium]|jgi:TonB-linked SusC/RagA family outer membrane protein|nr:TonB-dependent receptor [Prevotellaceae bacterium]
MRKKSILLVALMMAGLTGLTAQVSISGVVTDASTGERLAGVTVSEKGVSNATLTDADGRYAIRASSGGTLVFSSIGYERVETTDLATPLNVQLQPAKTLLDEVVVIGYGVMKKSDVTGAVASIKADALKKTPSSNLTHALQGRAAGVTVNANSGQPSEAAVVRIRGIGTLNNSDPIYVVDGIILNDISFLNPNDIEATEILKDASVAAIYGSRGANGVILITTKTGREEKGKIAFDAYAGVQSRWRKLDVMKSKEFAQTMINFNDVASEIEMYAGGKGFNRWLSLYRLGSSAYFPVLYDQQHPNGFNYSKQETDWQDEVFETAPVQSYNLSFSGSSKNLRYAFSAGYFDQDGTIIESYYKRLTLRTNISYQVRDWLKVGENITYMNATYRNAMHNSGSAGASIVTAALAMAPWDPTHYPAGMLNNAGENIGGRPSAASNFKNVTNPFSMVETTHPNDHTDRVVGDVYLELTPIAGLSIRSSVSMDLSNLRSRTFKEKYEYSSYDKNDKNFLSSSLSRYCTLIIENIATYARQLGKHSFSIMAGQTTEEYNYYSLGNSGSTILNPIPSNWYLSQTTDDNTNPAGDSVDRTRMLSLLGRVHYAFDNRYLLTVNFRADGSSKFPENTWGYFPSAAIGWRISQEAFLKDAGFIDDLKLRVGWGQLGNQSSVGSSDFSQEVGSGMYFFSYILGQTQAQALGAAINTFVNKNGRWEVTEQWNAAADFSFLKGAISGTVDFFRRDTKGMFLYVSAPAYTGNRFSPKANVGTVRNEGVEITLEHRKTVGDVSYTVGGNVSFIRNNLVALNGGFPVYGDRTVSTEGMALYTYYGYDYLGIYRSDDEANSYLYSTAQGTYREGDAKYRDVNGDGSINDDDRVTLGNPFPWLAYGLNLGVEWRGFDLQLFFQGVAGNELYNAQRHQLEGPGNETVMSTVMRDAWTPSTRDGTVPSPRNSVNFATSSRFIESGDYLRLKNVQIGYTVPQALSKRLHIDRLRVYAAANNLLTLTGYTGFDPEVGSGVDYGNYPQAMTVTLGCNIEF